MCVHGAQGGVLRRVFREGRPGQLGDSHRRRGGQARLRRTQAACTDMPSLPAGCPEWVMAPGRPRVSSTLGQARASAPAMRASPGLGPLGPPQPPAPPPGPTSCPYSYVLPGSRPGHRPDCKGPAAEPTSPALVGSWLWVRPASMGPRVPSYCNTGRAWGILTLPPDFPSLGFLVLSREQRRHLCVTVVVRTSVRQGRGTSKTHAGRGSGPRGCSLEEGPSSVDTRTWRFPADMSAPLESSPGASPRRPCPHLQSRPTPHVLEQQAGPCSRALATSACLESCSPPAPGAPSAPSPTAFPKLVTCRRLFPLP